jgi:CheY-like chemotaxis protein
MPGDQMRSVLVIDDKDELRSVIVTILTDAGYSVREASNGREGILMVLAQPPDLILCDVKMPQMDGYRTLAAIRAVPGTAAIPFILMTGSMGRDEFRHAMVCGADDYLMKPFSSNDLIKAVESRLARQTHVQSEALRKLQKSRHRAVPHFSPELTVPTGPSLAVAS